MSDNNQILALDDDEGRLKHRSLLDEFENTDSELLQQNKEAKNAEIDEGILLHKMLL